MMAEERCTIFNWRTVSKVLLYLSLITTTSAQNGGGSYGSHSIRIDPSKHDEEFFTFRSRPDIPLAPRWNITNLSPSQVAPGHWFISPYADARTPGSGPGWQGPYIYNSDGEMIWFGGPQVGHLSTTDFRVSRVGDQDMLSYIIHDEAKVYLLDETYTVQKTIDLALTEVERANMHEFTTKDNGTRGLHLVGHKWNASVEESSVIGFEGQCYVDYDGFREYDTETWQPVFEWNSRDLVDLEESWAVEGTAEEFCADPEGEPWDYLHLNAIDKFPDGDYLVSGRRTFTLYKVSHETGDIVWRLGGKNSSFDLDTEWTGQHGARVHSQNATHTLVSFFDNAKFYHVVEPTWNNTRALLLALHTTETPMRASTVLSIDRPDLEYTGARGNVETLDNGNLWVGWVKDCLLSEHDTDGNLLMEAHTIPPLTTYRTFKAPWIGRPTSSPDVVSFAENVNGETGTVVYVSWNGATEVDKWRLWESDREGTLGRVLAEEKWQGFETMMTSEFANYVSVEALDRNGERLGVSQAVRITSPEVPEDVSTPVEEETPTAMPEAEEQTQDDGFTSEAGDELITSDETEAPPISSSFLKEFVDAWRNPFIATILGAMVLTGIIGAYWIFVVRLRWRPAWWKGSGKYKAVADMESRKGFLMSEDKFEAASEFVLEGDEEDVESERGVFLGDEDKRPP